MALERESAERPPLRVAIVAHFAYGALSGNAGTGGGHIGGVEKQTTMMARWLASRGHEVTLLTWDEGQPDGIVIDGVRVLKLCRRDAGLPVVRFVTPRWTSLCRGLARAAADVYYQNCGEYVTGQVALWCRLHDRAFVYSSASDADCDGDLPLMPERRVRALYRIGVRLADRVIVQSGRQHRMLEAGFGRDATVIPMPCAPPGGLASVESVDRQGVVWIGRICRVKRPDRYLDVAALCPELRFTMVGPDDDDPDYTRAIRERAALLPNVTIRGAASTAEVDVLLRDAACLCCTSDHEGFPNTFLEAWSHGRPVVSTWDPDDLIAAHGLGSVARRDPADLAAALRSLARSPDAWRRASENARRYFDETHALDRVMPRFERVFLDAASGKQPTSPDRSSVARVAG
jgi:glycosyltransferase involved in cell wall biosynthesis